jgi:hypothetical protein
VKLSGLPLGILLVAAMGTAAGSADLSRVILVQSFVGDGDPGQCNGAAYGERIISSAADWSPAVRIDTDERPGGCLHSLGLVDLDHRLGGLEITIDFGGEQDRTQCGNPGPHRIPISRRLSEALLSTPMRYDMDDRPGGCYQVYSVKGRADVALEIEFRADGDASQCRNTGVHLVVPGEELRIGLDTDHRDGGCTLRYRLVPR